MGASRVVHTWYFNGGYDDLVFAGEVGKARQAEVERMLADDLAPTLGEHPQTPVDIVVRHAHAADAITAESDQAGVVVLGRHRSSVPWGPHLGSVVRAVLREATCPVIVVDEAARPTTEDEGDWGSAAT